MCKIMMNCDRATWCIWTASPICNEASIALGLIACKIAWPILTIFFQYLHLQTTHSKKFWASPMSFMVWKTHYLGVFFLSSKATLLFMSPFISLAGVLSTFRYCIFFITFLFELKHDFSINVSYVFFLSEMYVISIPLLRSIFQITLIVTNFFYRMFIYFVDKI